MIVIKTAIPDVLILEPKVFGDERGFFFESYNQQTFEESIDVKLHLFKIIIQNPKRTYSEGCIFREEKMHRVS